MNIPNRLSLSRICMIPLFIAAYFLPFEWGAYVAIGIFALCCFTDFLDGYLARKNNLVTDLGKFLDPIADKMLVACALFAVSVLLYDAANDVMLGLRITGVVCAMIILCRELLISGFRIVASSKNLVLAADKLGKIKTILQMFALILLLPVPDFYANARKNVVLLLGDGILYAGIALLILATVMAVISGCNYLIKNKQVLKDG